MVVGSGFGDDMCIASQCGKGTVIESEVDSVDITATLVESQEVFVAVDKDGNANFGSQMLLSVTLLLPPPPPPPPPPFACENLAVAIAGTTTETTVSYVAHSFPCHGIGRYA